MKDPEHRRLEGAIRQRKSLLKSKQQQREIDRLLRHYGHDLDLLRFLERQLSAIEVVKESAEKSAAQTTLPLRGQ